jgi:PAS domain S-box-containing protein
MNDVIGRSLEEFTSPESREIQQTALARVFETGESTTIEILGTGAQGAPAYYEVRIAPITEAGRIEVVILVATDITERKQAETALRLSQGSLKK